ncbi:hypothetical protein PENANT_c203G10317 [Penicillium antarcticum]|uniref:Uncharacterized protein n=1 Tax=Penicillium antarcticum TaxID=416450 RepID=A0A1V6P9N4_9EURO|nr:hypothetical protein PENANT_c203G10317 [Penicillium antarcticum]
MTTGIDKLQLLLTKDTRHSAEEHSDRRVKRERSSKTTLPRLCNNHDAISPRYSAPAYIKYAQSVSSKISDSIQQNQHRFNYDHKVRNKRTEPAHHTDFFAKQSHTHNDSTGIMEKSSKTDCHLDLDPETSWTVPLYVPTPPPVLAAAGHDDVRQLVHDRIVSHDVEDLHFRLIVRPKSQEAPGSMGTEKTFSSYFRPVVPISPLDPYFFVQNIAGNY